MEANSVLSLVFFENEKRKRKKPSKSFTIQSRGKGGRIKEKIGL